MVSLIKIAVTTFSEVLSVFDMLHRLTRHRFNGFFNRNINEKI